MSNPARTLIAVALVVAFCFTAISAKNTADECKDGAQVSTVTTVTKPETDQNSPAKSTLPTRTPAAPDAGEEINWWVIGGGGGSGSSTNYNLSGTIGQTAVYFGSSANYQLSSGFWQDFSGSNNDCCVGRVGDANGLLGDEPTIGDVVVMIDAKLINGFCEGIIACLTEADINQSGGIDADCDDITIGDIVILIDYLFITGSSLGLNDCM